MSTLKVTNIQATGETASRAVSGVAAAWLNLDGTGTATLRDSFNITSVTDDGTGRYDFAITNAMANTNYAINASGRQDELAPFTGQAYGVDTESASVAHISCRNTAGILKDQEIFCCNLHGDLA